MTNQPNRHASAALMAYVLAFATAALVPVVVLASALTWQWIDTQQENARVTARVVADAARSNVDRYIAGEIAMLRALADAPSIRAGDIRRFDAEMRVIARAEGTNIVLRGLDGARYADTRFEPGESLPKVPLMDGERELASSRGVFVSDLFVSSKGSMIPVTRVTVPVIHDGHAAYVLAARLPPSKLTAVLREAGVVPPYTGAVIDRSRNVIAHSEGSDAVIGSRWMADAANTVRGNETSVRLRDGAETFAVWRRLDAAGWSVSVSTDIAATVAPSHRWLWAIAGLAVGMVLLTGLLTLGVVRAFRRERNRIAPSVPSPP